MASNHIIPHFILIPLMAQGHQIPMVDMAKVLATHGVTITIVTTPQNSIRFDSIIAHAVELGLEIRLLRLRFPSTEVGLPENCESLDTIPSRDLTASFFHATTLLQQELEQFMHVAQPQPCCVISDRYLPWTSNVAERFRVPRLVFDGTSCFNLVCSNNIRVSKIYDRVLGFHEPFYIPNLPHQIEITKAQLPEIFNPGSLFNKELHDEMDKANETAYGLVVNSFEELEKEYLREAQRVVKGGKVWCVGPLSLCNKDKFDMSRRGNYKSSIDEDEVLKWLDSRPLRSVIYVCLGTLGILKPQQLVQLGLALEASKRPFIWAITTKGGSTSSQEIYFDNIAKLIISKERGLLIRGWGPQVLILAHEAVGGFLTHCGWNSTLEGVSAGVPMVTWPMFADQFYNERFVTQVLRIGVAVGVARAVRWGEEESDDGFVKSSEDILRAIEKVLGVGEGQEEMRHRARQIRERAKLAMEKGGPSLSNVSTMIQDVMQHYCYMNHVNENNNIS